MESLQTPCIHRLMSALGQDKLDPVGYDAHVTNCVVGYCTTLRLARLGYKRIKTKLKKQDLVLANQIHQLLYDVSLNLMT